MVARDLQRIVTGRTRVSSYSTLQGMGETFDGHNDRMFLRLFESCPILCNCFSYRFNQVCFFVANGHVLALRHLMR